MKQPDRIIVGPAGAARKGDEKIAFRPQKEFRPFDDRPLSVLLPRACRTGVDRLRPFERPRIGHSNDSQIAVGADIGRRNEIAPAPTGAVRPVIGRAWGKGQCYRQWRTRWAQYDE